jgi:hypothetical protein
MAKGSPDWQKVVMQKIIDSSVYEQRTFAYNIDVVAAAGNPSRTALKNTNWFGETLLVTSIFLRVDAATPIVIGGGDDNLMTMLGLGNNRYLGGPFSYGAILKSNTNGLITSPLLTLVPPVNTDYQVKDCVFCLGPPSSLLIETSNNNINLRVNYIWEELTE